MSSSTSNSHSKVIDVWCYARTQIPAEKTDYFDVVQHDGSGIPKAVYQTFRDLHTTLAQRKPEKWAYFSFPVSVHSPSGEETYLCQAFVEHVRDPSRHFVRLVAWAASVDDLKQNDINPVALLSAVVCDQILLKKKPSMQIEVAQGTVEADGKLVSEIKQALDGEKKILVWPTGANSKKVFQALWLALERVSPSHRFRIGFAVGVPAGLSLPFDFQLTVLEALPVETPSKPEQNGKNSSPIVTNSPSIGLEHLATIISRSEHLEPLWRARFWNQVQDMIWLISDPRSFNEEGHVRNPRALVNEMRKRKRHLKYEMQRAEAQVNLQELLEQSFQAFQEAVLPTPRKYQRRDSGARRFLPHSSSSVQEKMIWSTVVILLFLLITTIGWAIYNHGFTLPHFSSSSPANATDADGSLETAGPSNDQTVLQTKHLSSSHPSAERQHNHPLNTKYGGIRN